LDVLPLGDLTRRSIISRLDPKIDRPELRQFDYDPLAHARDNRAEVVAAALTIMKAHHVAGRPGRPPRLQSFEDWSDTVRGALMWVGLEDPAATQDTLRQNDPKLTILIRVATVWRKAFGAYRRPRPRRSPRRKRKTGPERMRNQNLHPQTLISWTPSWRSLALALR
jgi:hypothetical protein